MENAAMQRIDLVGLDGVLTVSPGEADWSQVVLHQRDDSLPLGADLYKMITGKLITFLDERYSGTRWVISLSERHHSIYGEYLEGKAVLRIQNAHGKKVATLEVSPEQQAEWSRILRGR